MPSPISGSYTCSVIESANQGLRVEIINRNRDGKFVTDFDTLFKDAGVRVITTATHAPNQNAFIGRWIQSIKQECLRNFMVFGKRSTIHTVSTLAMSGRF